MENNESEVREEELSLAEVTEETAAEETVAEETAEETEEAVESGEGAAEETEAEETATEESEPHSEEKPKRKINKKKLFTGIGIAAGALAALYLGGALFYTGHFFIGTTVGSYNCSNLNAAKATEKITTGLDNYSFTFYERDDKQETINGSEIYFEHTPVEGMEELVKEQNPFTWPYECFRKHELPLDVEVTYNNDSLYNRISQLDFMKATRENAAGKSGAIYYADGQYAIEDDGGAVIVSQNDIYHMVKPKIYDLYEGMSLEKENCYKGLASEDTIRGVLNLLNKYVGTQVTYLNGDNQTVLNKDTINEWLSVDESYNVWIDEQKARDYVNELAKGYDTVGTNRTFHTTGGSDITVSGGSYGWNVNNAKETEELLNIIRSGESVEREPVYKQKAAVHGASDIGKTYVEVSIGGQHMWYYKDGNLVVSSDCVTGNTSLGRGTHTGVYYVMYKDKNVTLKGEGYETPVTFWMPFNGGEGLHDALWRGAFGGSIYRGAGSHGCVNLPYGTAQTLYQNITPGDPVVVY